MCDFVSRQVIEQVVREKCAAADTFTALEVTREAKRRGCGERHRALKEVVHQAFAAGAMPPGYQRRLVAIAGAPQLAWLYFPLGVNPRMYPLLRRSSAPYSPRRSSGPIGHRLDKRLRLCMPAHLVRQAGLRPGDRVWAVASDNSEALVLTGRRPSATQGRVLGSYRIDRSGNVRMRQGTLRQAALNGNAYAMEAQPGRLWVRLQFKLGGASFGFSVGKQPPPAPATVLARCS